MTETHPSMVLVIVGTGHCLACGKDCRAGREDYSEMALCMCADCGPKIDDDAILIAVAAVSRASVAAAAGIVELQPGLKVRFSKPGLYDEQGNLVSREVTPVR
jgi:hypothetical protein